MCHGQSPKCVSFKFKVSVTYNFKHISLSPFHTILVLILFNMFYFIRPAKDILICNVLTINALFLLAYVRFYKKNCGRWIYHIAQYKHFFNGFIDYLYICESLKFAWLINQTRLTATCKMFVLVASYLIKCFKTQDFLNKFSLTKSRKRF